MDDLFGDRLRHAREQESMTQFGLARAAGCSQAKISRWENGSAHPRLSDLFALCRELAISSDLLLGLEEINP